MPEVAFKSVFLFMLFAFLVAALIFVNMRWFPQNVYGKTYRNKQRQLRQQRIAIQRQTKVPN